MRTINIGIIGLGTVGGGVVRMIAEHRESYASQRGVDLRIGRVCSRSDRRLAELGIASELFTADWRDVVSDSQIDIVVEVIGGEHPATEIFEAAFRSGKHIVTANKALLGRNMGHLAGMASENGVQLRCEAAVAGGIPIVATVEDDLAGNRILGIAGIMNGTTNYILSRMRHEGLSFGEVLSAAQEAGYAEADPTADVDGFDAASKIAILSSIGFRTRITTDDVYMQGIRNVSADDMAWAEKSGYVIKLLAIARNTETGADVRVHPAMIPAAHPLASVDGAMNAVFVVGDAVGETMFYGAGAGSLPTASAVVGDILALATPLAAGVAPLPEPVPYARDLAVRDVLDLETAYYVRFAIDGSGEGCGEAVAEGAEAGAEAAAKAMATVAGVLAEHGVSVSVPAECTVSGDGGRFGMLATEAVSERTMRDALEAACGAAGVTVASLIRIEDVNAWR